ncbi:hypothetical protein BS78_02G327200 [Paspalum vaginatum]|nr:hypothetical protein BS78_02G327200 [Paspalum vaginatum]
MHFKSGKSRGIIPKSDNKLNIPLVCALPPPLQNEWARAVGPRGKGNGPKSAIKILPQWPDPHMPQISRPASRASLSFCRRHGAPTPPTSLMILYTHPLASTLSLATMPAHSL